MTVVVGDEAERKSRSAAFVAFTRQVPTLAASRCVPETLHFVAVPFVTKYLTEPEPLPPDVWSINRLSNDPLVALSRRWRWAARENVKVVAKDDAAR